MFLKIKLMNNLCGFLLKLLLRANKQKQIPPHMSTIH